MNRPTIYLLIDGNNLEHRLYRVINDQQLFRDIGSYLHNYKEIVIELFLDHYKGKLPQIDRLFVRPARHEGGSDPEIIERARQHAERGDQTVVVTEDTDLRSRVEPYCEIILWPDQFVACPSARNPTFVPPSIFEHYRVKQQTREKIISQKDLNWLINLSNSSNESKATLHLHEIERNKNFDKKFIPFLAEINGTMDQNFYRILSRQLSRMNDFPVYHIRLQSWNAKRGIYFILNSFCSQHFPDALEFWTNIDGQKFTLDKLEKLTALLIKTCGSEDKFCTQGSILDRARRAILCSNGYSMDLEKLAIKTHVLPSQLRKIIRMYGGSWISTSKK